MSDARRYAVWPDPRSRSRSRVLESHSRGVHHQSCLGLILSLANFHPDALATVALENCRLVTTVNIQTDNFSDVYLPLAFPPYLLSPETMMSLPDCELHLSTLARLHAQNATHPLLIIVCWTTSNRCDCFYCFDYHVHVLYFILLLL